MAGHSAHDYPSTPILVVLPCKVLRPALFHTFLLTAAVNRLLNGYNRTRAITSMSVLAGNPISGIVDSVPEFKGLSISVRTQLFNFLERRFEKNKRKLANSPYEPCRDPDILHLNHDFPSAVCNWLRQFPESDRLGLLCVALSVIYLPEQEFDLFIDAAVEKLKLKITEHLNLLSSEADLAAHMRRTICPYAVSEFGNYDKVVRKLQIDGSRDRDKRPIRGMVDEFLLSVVKDMHALAEHGDTFNYYDRDRSRIMQVIESLIDSQIILVEDCSFSGTRVKKDLRRFLRLCHVFFHSFTDRIRESSKEPPRIYLLLPFGTKDALDSVDPRTAFTGETDLYRHFDVVFGFVFGSEASARGAIPGNLEQLQLLFPNLKLGRKIRDALLYFHRSHSFKYWTQDTGIGIRSASNEADLALGFAGGGWTIVTHNNCPNNCLPPLWYPLAPQKTEEPVHALFPRLESRRSNTGTDYDVDDGLEMIRKDGKQHIRRLLTSIYDEIL